jgi:hypothetical protein
VSKLAALKDVGRFLWTRKRHWMIPLVGVLVLLGVLLVLAEGSAAAPFVYTLF